MQRLSCRKQYENRGAIASKEIFIKVSDGACFSTIAKQLEHPAEWDLLILHVWPVSSLRVQARATSYVFIDFLGKKFHALATVSEYKPKNKVSWTLSGDYEIRIYWQLEPKINGTLIRVTLAWQAHGWFIGSPLYRTMQRKGVERLLSRMLVRLKKTVEKEAASQGAESGVAIF
ncbi:MAG: hypothetical protein PHY28_10065 [Dehalococcoidales bacterium]|nr:hypothetical protein [Dehalococcoidales bacterium]